MILPPKAIIRLAWPRKVISRSPFEVGMMSFSYFDGATAAPARPRARNPNPRMTLNMPGPSRVIFSLYTRAGFVYNTPATDENSALPPDLRGLRGRHRPPGRGGDA